MIKCYHIDTIRSIAIKCYHIDTIRSIAIKCYHTDSLLHKPMLIVKILDY